MRLFQSLGFLACALVAAGPLLACPVTRGENINPDFVQAFIKAAEKLETPCPVTYKETTPEDIQIEYLAEGETGENWKRMMTVNLIKVDGESGAFIEDVTATFIKRIKGMDGVVMPVATAKHDMGKMYVMRYHVGNGEGRENALAVIRPVGPDKIAVIHWQKRGSAHDDAAVRLFAKINGITEDLVKTGATAKNKKASVAPVENADDSEKKPAEETPSPLPEAVSHDTAVTPPAEEKTSPGKILKTKSKREE